MIGEIIKAVMDECQAYLQSQGQGGTVILKTDYRHQEALTYTMPLVLTGLTGAPNSHQLIGGLTQMEWQFAFNAYNLMPDPYNQDTTSYSADLLNTPIDSIRQHFSTGLRDGWLTPGMTNILTNYGFRFTLSGVLPADPLDDKGQVMGYRIIFDSLAFDTETLNAADSTVVLGMFKQEE